MALATDTAKVPENIEIDGHKFQRIAKCNWAPQSFRNSVGRKPCAGHGDAFSGWPTEPEGMGSRLSRIAENLSVCRLPFSGPVSWLGCPTIQTSEMLLGKSSISQPCTRVQQESVYSFIGKEEKTNSSLTHRLNFTFSGGDRSIASEFLVTFSTDAMVSLQRRTEEVSNPLPFPLHRCSFLLWNICSFLVLSSVLRLFLPPRGFILKCIYHLTHAESLTTWISTQDTSKNMILCNIGENNVSVTIIDPFSIEYSDPGIKSSQRWSVLSSFQWSFFNFNLLFFFFWFKRRGAGREQGDQDEVGHLMVLPIWFWLLQGTFSKVSS